MHALRFNNAFLFAMGIALACFALAFCFVAEQPLSAFADEEENVSLVISGEEEALDVVTAESLDLPAWAAEDEDIAVFLTTINEKANDVKAAEETAAAAEEGVALAQQKVEELQGQIEEMKATIKKTEGQLTDQKQKSADALKLQYMLDASGFNLTDFIFSSTTLNDFVRNLEYMDHLQDLNLSEIGRYAEMKAEYEQAQADLKKKESEAAEEQRVADARLEDSRVKLEEAKAARVQAEEDLAAEVAVRAKALEDTGTIDDNVDWDMSKEDFIEEWGARIDAYLAGSALAGNGEVFAEAAWDNHIDPRWSPAISCVESGKGRSCFLPHNAWGWGSYSFGSWEEAIPAHVSYLGSMYGSTITREAASIYCPPNASFWYNRCLEEMNKI